MSEIADFLKGTTAQFVATVGPDGRPRNRPFQFAMEKDGRLWYCTSNRKEVYDQLQANPYVEISALNDRFEWIRIRAKVVFVDDIGIKDAILDAMPDVKNIYGSGSNPVLEAFYLADGEAVVEGFGGDPPLPL